MDLAAEMLLRHLHDDPACPLDAARVCPSFRRRFGLVPWLGRFRPARNADRLLNRHWYYPRYLRRRVADFDLFHLCDHSYAQLVHVLPEGRAGVYCHDLDTFRCLLEPKKEPRPAWFRAMARRILHGFQKAAVVFHTTLAIRRQIEAFGLIDPGRLIHAPNGVSAEFTVDPGEPGRVSAGSSLPALTQPGSPARPGSLDEPFLLHVGSSIPRKRIDVLLDVFAEVRRRFPGLRLVQIGGSWTAAQAEQLRRLGIAETVQQLRNLSRAELAAYYRRAALVLQPSEAEGFGLPVAEALACGAVVVASDIPPLREVGGDAAVFCPVADLPAWVETVGRLLARPEDAPALDRRLSQAGRFTWTAQARTIAAGYARLV